MLKIQTDQNKIIDFKDNILAWIDDSTNLMWEIKSRDNYPFMYVWHKSYVKNAPIGEGSGSGKEIPYETEIKDATSYVKRLNNKKYAGFSDWRLPTVEELETLIESEGIDYFIKKPLQNNTLPAYWTDTPTSATNVYSIKGFSWKDTAHIPFIKIVDFQKAVILNYKPDRSLWLRCVRSGGNEKRTKFLTFQEAKTWAKENPGGVITKSPDGFSYVIKNG